jgi:hypothetical protein
MTDGVPRAAEGFRLGVLMLDTRFARPVGDIGNPDSFPFEVDYEIVTGARVDRIVRSHPIDAPLIHDFIDAGRRLAGRGAKLVATSCGFLFPCQQQLAAALPVPVISSALCALPRLRTRYGNDARLGILTFNRLKLERLLDHTTLQDIDIEGICQDGELYGAISQDRQHLNQVKAARECKNALGRLLTRSPDIAALILECTNLPPYRSTLQSDFPRPIWDISDLIHDFAGTRSISPVP